MQKKGIASTRSSLLPLFLLPLSSFSVAGCDVVQVGQEQRLDGRQGQLGVRRGHEHAALACSCHRDGRGAQHLALGLRRVLAVDLRRVRGQHLVRRQVRVV